MAISKQLPILSKPDAYAYAYTGHGTLGITTNRVPTHSNGYFEFNANALTDSRKIAFCKRPGVVDSEYIAIFPNLKCTNAAERIKGLVTSLDKTKVIFITQDATKRYSNIYDASTNTLTQTDISASFAAGQYVFTQLDGINYGSNVVYAATNSTEGALITAAGVWSKITDADYTNLGVKTNFVGLDGYLFFGVISGTGAGRIYNSDLSKAAAATGWTATSYISSADVPGAIVWLERIRNYIVCFKQASIEFFEDVGAPTPGSPLEARKGLTKVIGCASASSVQKVHDGIIFLGIDRNGKQSVYKLSSDDLSLKKISTSVIDTSLHNGLVSVANFQVFSNDYEGSSNVAKAQSQVILWHNKELYATTLYSYFDGSEITMVYDNELDIWMHWATNFAGADDGSDIDQHFIPSMCFQLTAGTTTGIFTYFANNYSGITKSRFCTFVSLDNANSVDFWKDGYDTTAANFQNYPMVWRSEHFDFGTNDRKFWHSLEVIFDSPSASGQTGISGTMRLNIDRTPKQAANYSTAQSIYPEGAANGLSGLNRFKISRLGSFRSAAINLFTFGAFPVRIWAVEAVYSGGPQYA